MVADNSITGGESGQFNELQLAYFERIKAMKLDSKVLIGFGIKNRQQFESTKEYANGAIIGSEFIRQLNKDESEVSPAIKKFIKGILNN